MLRNRRWDSAGVQIARVGSASNELFGDEGFDVLLGGAGNDELDAGPGGSIMFADAFTAGVTLSFDFSSFLDFPSPESAKGLLGDVLKLEIEIGLPGDGHNANTVIGGTGFDLILGGKGNDTVYAGGGIVDVVFGFAGNDIVSANATQIGSSQSQTATSSSILFGGAGDDTITGGSRSLIVGGDGNDAISGGDGLDILIGDSFTFTLNGQDAVDGFVDFKGLEEGKIQFRVGVHAAESGNDTLFGNGSRTSLIGGDGDDTLQGGTGWNLLFGDSSTSWSDPKSRLTTS